MKIDDKYRWLVERWTWHLNWQGYRYCRISIKGKRYSRKLHRCVWAIAHKIPYSEVPMLDHINRDRADNRLENLRITNPSLNANNSKFAGVGIVNKQTTKKRGDCWRSRVRFRNKAYHLGVFPKKSRARLASRVVKKFLMNLEEAML